MIEEPTEPSNWAFHQCLKGYNNKGLRNQITHSYFCFRYCLEIKDIEEMWSRITDDYWRFRYCATIKDRKELYTKITDPLWCYQYCCSVSNRPEIWSHSKNKLLYTKFLEHHPEKIDKIINIIVLAIVNCKGVVL